jgi:uncharacterized protein (TIGR03083 family)
VSGGFAPEDTARHYQNAHQRIVELVRPLSDEQLATPVPAAPGWDVHDVLAHVAAIPTDALAGRLTGIPTDEFTSEQVRRRRAATVDELIEEWRGNVGKMLELTHAGLVPPNLAVDAVSHEQDIRGALGVASVPDRDAVRFSLDLFAGLVCTRVGRAGGVSLRIAATDTDFVAESGEGSPPVTLRASEFELFRTFSGRRGRRAVLDMAWDGDATPLLPYLNIFGPVPDYDVAD